MAKRSVRRPDLDWEIRLGFPSLAVIGVDEVGRGCLAGPVVAGAVILSDQASSYESVMESCPWLMKVTDSKLLSPEQRTTLSPLIQSWAKRWAIGVASVEEIDSLNIFHASHLAMVRAIEKLSAGVHSAHVLVDGKFIPKGLKYPATAVVKGDLRCLSIACASIIAKVWRDERMAELDTRFPGYGFAEHKGYSTPAHSSALKRLGACEIHRRTFAPVAEVLKVSAGALRCDLTKRVVIS